MTLRYVLVTGLSGAIGSEFSSILAARFPDPVQLVGIFRTSQSYEIWRSRQSQDVVRRIYPHIADLTVREEIASLISRLDKGRDTLGIHLAAEVNWGKPAAQVQTVNIEGTINFAELLTAVSDSSSLVYISTAYTDVEGWAYNNSYEQSKADAEAIIRAKFPHLMPSVFKCSIVVGHSTTGVISRFSGIYGLIAYMYRRSPPFVVHKPGAKIDLVPVDWVSHELVAHIDRHLDGRRETTIASAGEASKTLGDLLPVVVQTINKHLIAVRRPTIAPVLIEPRRWNLLRECATKWPTGQSMPEMRIASLLMDRFGCYLLETSALRPRNVELPVHDASLIIEKSVDYWVAQNNRI